jgi:undecaprenyl phosphate-alpha-L-ara4N flippase subunit ArnE
MKTPLSSMLLVLAASFIGSFGMVILKAGADRLTSGLRHMFFSWRVGVGVLLFGVSSIFYMFGVKQGNLTVLYPLVSLGYVWTLLWARVFFHESFNRSKWFGLALILLGVVSIGLGNR